MSKKHTRPPGWTKEPKPAALESKGFPPPPYSLRLLEAELEVTEIHTTTEIETEGDCAGQYVWRDENGEKYYWSRDKPERYGLRTVDSVEKAHHLDFLCPLCFQKNRGPVGTHHVLVSFAGRDFPEDAGSRGSNGPTRWEVSGRSLDDLVLKPSIQLLGGCNWHGYVGSSGIPPGHAG